MSFNDCLQKATDLLGRYESMINLSNGSALNNHAKTSEDVYCGLLKILYPNSRFKRSDKVNEKGVDLVDPVSDVAVQIKSRLKKNEIQSCVEKFSQTHWCKHEKYDLVILLTGSKCSVEEQDFEVENYSYRNHSGSYIDNTRLLNLVDVQNCAQVLHYLRQAIDGDDDQVGRSNITNETIHNNTGPVFNFSNQGDVNLDGMTFDLSADNRQVALSNSDNFANALSYFDKGLFKESAVKFKELAISTGREDSSNHLYYVLSKISAVNIYNLKEVEVKKIYEHLNHLSKTEHENLGNLLWLIVYFENVATQAPSSAIESLMHEKLSTISFSLSSNDKALLERVEVYSPPAKEILSKTRCGLQTYDK